MNWLETLSIAEIGNGKFPIQNVLDHSLYYPSCEFDGGVVKDCNTLGRDFGIVSFVYCDYAVGKHSFNRMQDTFVGYHVLHSRDITPSELTPNRWHPQVPPNFNRRAYEHWKNEWKPFCKWTVYERDNLRGPDHGPKRFSLLYIGGEGVATYQALYWSNQTAPKALAIIQPGTGFGLNWTDFREQGAPLNWVVCNNPAGQQPDILYYGGIGKNYAHFDWDGYQRFRIIHDNYGEGGEVGVWRAI